MDTPTLKQILLEEMQKYTGKGLNDVATLTVNDAAQMYVVIDVAQIRNKRVVGAVLVAHLEQNQIVIDLDVHDKTLAEALEARGVPASQIRRAYRDDALPVS